jgi:hypothetical protein
MSHRGRAVRVLVALFLSLVGLLPMGFYGWVLGLPLFGPAAVLMVFAGLDRHSRRGVIYCAVPTVLGLGLALMSVVGTAPDLWRSGALPIILGLTLATTTLAAFVGSPGQGA